MITFTFDKYIAALFLLFSASADALEPCYSGSWYEQVGEGVNLEVREGDYHGFFYTWEWEGGTQKWYVFTGDPETGEGTLFDVVGRGYRETLDVVEYEVGTVSLVPTTEGLLFAYSIKTVPGDDPWCLDVRCADTLDLVRLTGECP